MQNNMVSGTFVYEDKVENYTYEPNQWKKWTTKDCLIIERIAFIALYVLITIVTSFVFFLVDQAKKFKAMKAGKLEAIKAADIENETSRKAFIDKLDTKITRASQNIDLAEQFLRECESGTEIPQIALRFIVPLEIEKRIEIWKVLEKIKASPDAGDVEKMQNFINEVKALEKDLLVITRKVKEITRFWRGNDEFTVEDLSDRDFLDEALIPLAKELEKRASRDKLKVWFDSIPSYLQEVKRKKGVFTPVITLEGTDLQEKEFFNFYTDYSDKLLEAMDLRIVKIQTLERDDGTAFKHHCEWLNHYIQRLKYIHKVIQGINSSDKTREEVVALIDDHFGEADAMIADPDALSKIQTSIDQLRAELPF